MAPKRKRVTFTFEEARAIHECEMEAMHLRVQLYQLELAAECVRAAAEMRAAGFLGRNERQRSDPRDPAEGLGAEADALPTTA